MMAMSQQTEHQPARDISEGQVPDRPQGVSCKEENQAAAEDDDDDDDKFEDSVDETPSATIPVAPAQDSEVQAVEPSKELKEQEILDADPKVVDNKESQRDSETENHSADEHSQQENSTKLEKEILSSNQEDSDSLETTAPSAQESSSSSTETIEKSQPARDNSDKDVGVESSSHSKDSQAALD